MPNKPTVKNPDSLRDLALAVVRQAVDDWRYLCKGGKPERDLNFTELEEFFKNDCAKLLACTNISANTIYKQMLRERMRMHKDG